MRAWLLVGLLGCGGPTAEPPTGSGAASGDPAVGAPVGDPGTTAGTPGGTTSTYGWACRSDVPANELNGMYPDAEIPPPDFTALNSDGSTRTKDDLMGHITVMWFYPAAGTAG